jgi:hypothetical protein
MPITCSFMFNLAPIRSMTGTRTLRPGVKVRIAAEGFHRVVEPLRHHLDRRPERRGRQDDQQDAEDLETAEDGNVHDPIQYKCGDAQNALARLYVENAKAR